VTTRQLPTGFAANQRRSHQQLTCGTITVPLGRYSSASQDVHCRTEFGPGFSYLGVTRIRVRARAFWADTADWDLTCGALSLLCADAKSTGQQSAIAPAAAKAKSAVRSRGIVTFNNCLLDRPTLAYRGARVNVRTLCRLGQAAALA
jgi:hypothetical protein